MFRLIHFVSVFIFSFLFKLSQLSFSTFIHFGSLALFLLYAFIGSFSRFSSFFFTFFFLLCSFYFVSFLSFSFSLFLIVGLSSFICFIRYLHLLGSFHSYLSQNIRSGSKGFKLELLNKCIILTRFLASLKSSLSHELSNIDDMNSEETTKNITR